MKLICTKNRNLYNSISNSILNSNCPYGLWTLPFIPKVSNNFLYNLPNYSFNQIAYNVSKYYNLDKEFGDKNLKNIIKKSFDFPIYNKPFENNIEICELYHGKSLSFKDFGVSFTANILEEINNKKLKILTCTTGDTGSAVAAAFYEKKNIEVHILYPKNKISEIQRKQMTTYGNNIYCYEINGDFDYCQKIVKKLLKENPNDNLTTCNSINIGRILGQLFYYFYTCKNHLDKKINITIPTGNMGNSLSCIISKKMGLPINNIILACNHNSNLNNLINYKKVNNLKIDYSLANAIDIQYPSNLERLQSLIEINALSSDILNNINITKTNNKEILHMINYCYEKHNIILDPHTAVGLDSLIYKNKFSNYNNKINIIMSTASPYKFFNEINYDKNIILPDEVKELKNKKEYITKCDNYEDILKYIL